MGRITHFVRCKRTEFGTDGSKSRALRWLLGVLPVMPRYYFHVRRGQLSVIDREGMELANDAEAAREAGRRGRMIATNQALRGIPTRGGLIIVDDQWDNGVLELPLEVC